MSQSGNNRQSSSRRFGNYRSIEQLPPQRAPPRTVARDESLYLGPRVNWAKRGRMNSGSVEVQAKRRTAEYTGSPSERIELAGYAARPGYGTLGRKYRMFANHFALSILQNDLTVYHYHIGIFLDHSNVKLTGEDKRLAFWKCLEDNMAQLGIDNKQSFYKIVFDDKSNCYTIDAFKLSTFGNTKKFVVDVFLSKFDGPVRLDVLIRAVGPKSVGLKQILSQDQDSVTPMQILDVVLRQFRSHPMLYMSKSFCPFGDVIFMIPGIEPKSPRRLDLGRGREVWQGLFSSVQIGQHHQFLVNMDVSHAAFYKGNGDRENRYSVIQFLCDVLKKRKRKTISFTDQITPIMTLDKDEVRIFRREIKAVRICVNDPGAKASGVNREFRVIGLDKPPGEITFTMRDGFNGTLAEYFRECCDPLIFPLLPTVKVGTKLKPIFLPMEYCFLAKNQMVFDGLTWTMKRLMKTQSCTRPEIRKKSIERMVSLAEFGDDPFLKNFGISIDPRMVEVEGRILPAPAIGYGENSTVMVGDGVWEADGLPFHSPAECSGLAALVFGEPLPQATDFIESLLQTCTSVGMRMPPPNSVCYHHERDPSRTSVEKALRTVWDKLAQSGRRVDLVIVFIPTKPNPLYADVKRVAELEMGIMTQCIVNKTLRRIMPETLLNIAFKVNMKLGGINCILSVQDAAHKCLLNAPTLVLGVDVARHPKEPRAPLVASVVGSMDATHMRYAASVKVENQRRGSPPVDLFDPVSVRIASYCKTTQTMPERIIVYRRGVSEGELRVVLCEEMRAIREACQKFDENFRPKITFVVIQKDRTRLFPSDPKDSCKWTKNVFPGTVVDKNILFDEHFNFFLCSHASLEGTSRPTRYHVLHDDNNFTADDMQLLTFHLCHCFSRCSRSVSIPAPLYYAHLTCLRARHHLQTIVDDERCSDVASNYSGYSIPDEQLIKGVSVQESIRNEMYFT